MTRHCGRTFRGVAARRALINDCRCLLGLSTALPWPRAASRDQLSTRRAWLCVCSPGIQSASQELGEAGGMCSAEQQAHEATHIIFQSFLQRTTIFSVPIELNYILSGPRSCLDAFEQLGAFTDDALDTVTAG